jgi:hypothetical protein
MRKGSGRKNGKVDTHIYLEPETVRWLRKRAADHRRTMPAEIEYILEIIRKNFTPPDPIDPKDMP